MTIAKKTPEEIETLAEGGKILARILRELSAYVAPGMTTEDVDDKAMALVEQYGVEPVLLGYHPDFAPTPYPAAICTSVNNVVQHGIPTAECILKEGDIINLDMSIGHKGLIVDSGVTVGIGGIDEEAARLIEVTKEALQKGISVVHPGGHIGDIGAAVDAWVRAGGFHTVEALCGHGVGYAVHEPPLIPNVGTEGAGPEIEVGHVYAIEPIVNVGTKDVFFDDEGDGYSVYTADGSRSAHFEHTVAVTKDGPRILTME